MAAEDRGPQVAAVAILFLVLAWIFVSLRCYVRVRMIKNFGLDDLLAVVTLILFTLYCTFVLKGVEYGTGQHLANLPAANIPKALKWWWCCELAYISSTVALKICIGIFLSRICIKPIHRWTIYVVLAVVIAYSTYYFFLIVFQCQPSSYFWTQYLGATGKCVPTSMITDSTYAHSAVSAMADWTLGILPIFLVWDLAMTTRTKISVALILALGAIGSTATLVRIPYIHQLSQGDFLYSTTDVAIWSTVEPGIGLTAASMATLRPLFRTFLSRTKLFGSSTRSRSNSTPFPNNNAQNNNRAGYVRSESRGRDLEDSAFRGESGEIGVVTTIQSINAARSMDGDSMKLEEIKRSGDNEKKLKWNETASQRGLKDDSSEEFLPVQKPPRTRTSWCVRKTTEVETQSVVQGSSRQGRR